MIDFDIEKKPPTRQEIQIEKSNLIDKSIYFRKRITKVFNFVCIVNILPVIYLASLFGDDHTFNFFLSAVFSFLLGSFISCLFFNMGSIDFRIRNDRSFKIYSRFSLSDFLSFEIPIVIASLITFFLGGSYLIILFCSLVVTASSSMIFTESIYNIFLLSKQKAITKFTDCTDYEIRKISKYLDVVEIKDYCHKVGLQGRELISLEFHMIEDAYNVRMSDLEYSKARDLVYNKNTLRNY